jgi:transcriptional regulator with XRE-family HTH domain
VVTTESSAFAGRLVELREAAGITKYELARRAGMTRQALSLLERGEREPNWVTVQRLAAALGVSCEAFADPSALAPPPELPRPRGRPRKAVSGEEPAPPKPRGKRKGKQ